MSYLHGWTADHFMTGCQEYLDTDQMDKIRGKFREQQARMAYQQIHVQATLTTTWIMAGSLSQNTFVYLCKLDMEAIGCGVGRTAKAGCSFTHFTLAPYTNIAGPALFAITNELARLSKAHDFKSTADTLYVTLKMKFLSVS